MASLREEERAITEDTPELRFCSGLHGGIDRPMTPN
jgi:hypothetical protein